MKVFAFVALFSVLAVFAEPEAQPNIPAFQYGKAAAIDKRQDDSSILSKGASIIENPWNDATSLLGQMTSALGDSTPNIDSITSRFNSEANSVISAASSAIVSAASSASANGGKDIIGSLTSAAASVASSVAASATDSKHHSGAMQEMLLGQTGVWTAAIVGGLVVARVLV
ncbi:uncharacterized protein L203_101556 [Cryptococcus depauperatus CBS 7841]|uniref:Uncharacterized protein n=1 Tax=Cryptococcus depauperatus CBS 7841 TaxID=1295531 RepID=A0AAJ8JQ35_9TREE